jgi:uncharacterized Rmd1/YagE family protein
MVFELNNNLLFLIVFGIIVLWVFTNTNKNVKENLADFTSESSNKIDQNMCSKQCCKFAQWPLPAELYERTIPE